MSTYLSLLYVVFYSLADVTQEDNIKKRHCMIPLTSDPQTKEPSSDTLTSKGPQDDARLQL